MKTLKKRHGKSRTRTYRIWTAIKQRCHNPKSDAFRYYGGRGIKVCPEWKQSFAEFLKDMGECPSPGHSIERIKNHLGYAPGNCRWAVRGEQMRNTRRNRWYTYNGKTMVMEDWAVELGIKSHTLLWRIRNWGVEKSLSTVGPKKKTDPKTGHRMLTLGNETKSLSDWARGIGISKQLLRQRISRWGLETALTSLPPTKDKSDTPSPL